jgi:hypothetical protein
MIFIRESERESCAPSRGWWIAIRFCANGSISSGALGDVYVPKAPVWHAEGAPVPGSEGRSRGSLARGALHTRRRKSRRRLKTCA